MQCRGKGQGEAEYRLMQRQGDIELSVNAKGKAIQGVQGDMVYLSHSAEAIVLGGKGRGGSADTAKTDKAWVRPDRREWSYA